ncbi:MAG: hypothetical protein KatS3mg032_0458 [Cyclobacteriaceae bacterium]|nr:MAG: hypothetical protein KatS3mg032_0458 [Cyclobacteriaceae bacterium]
MRNTGIILLCAGTSLVLLCCRKQQEQVTHFTRADSVTHQYLEFKDSLMDTWNLLLHEDNSRIAAVKRVIQELQASEATDRDFLNALMGRADQLLRIRFTPKTLSNTDVIEEYDFAATSVITEAIAASERLPDFASRQQLQEQINQIRRHDSLLQAYRLKYDRIATRYNAFLDLNKEILKEIDKTATDDKRPLFHLAEE